MYDVVVVGGGPAGCHAASLLARKGFDVHVLEEHPAIGEPVDCSGVIGAESFSALRLPESVKLGQIDGLTFVSPAQIKVRFLPSSPLAYVVDRAAVDRVIAGRAAESGAVFHLGTRVADLNVLDGCVEVTCQSPFTDHRSRFPDHRSLVRARVVILAGGPHYKFQRRLGMGRPKDFLRTAQAEVFVRGITETKVFLGSGVAPGSFAWIVPFRKDGKDRARVGVSAKVAALPYLRALLDGLLAAGHLTSREAPARSWMIPVSPLRKAHSDRVLAVGDAAGQTKPTSGGGIYYGLLGAEAAAETVALAFHQGDLSERALCLFERLWRRRLGREITWGRFFRRLAERLRDDEIDDLFRVVNSDGILTSVSALARFDWHSEVIRFALRNPGLGGIFLRGVFRRAKGEAV